MTQEIPLHGGNLINEARRIGCRTDQLLDASASLVPFPISKSLRECLLNSLKRDLWQNYPDRDHVELRQTIANWHRVDPAMVLPGNGAAELLTWAAKDARCLGKSALPSPGFSDYERALHCWQATFSYNPLPRTWTAQRPQNFPLSPETDVLWITNPHNPTGQLWSRESIVNLLPNYKLVICDEAFLPLVPDGEHESLVSLIPNHPNLVVVRSLTKLFALAGIRLGYAIGDPDRMQRWQACRDPWPLNAFAIVGGIHLMSDHLALEKWVHKVNNWVQKEGQWLYHQLDDIKGIKPYPSSANFLLIEGEDSLLNLREQMIQRRILLRDCRSFVGLGERWLRIGLQEHWANRRIINALKTCSIN